MRSTIQRCGFFIAVACLVVVQVACGGSGSPTAPTATGSSSSGGSASGGAAAQAGATISGTVAGASGANSLVAAATDVSSVQAVNGLRVSVHGTNISTEVSASGAFSLANVPAGDARLMFSGGGVNASTTVSSLATGDSISIVVAVSGTTAVVLSDSRRGSLEQDLEGRVDGIPASDVVSVGGRNVKVIESTRITEGSASRTFADLKVGTRIHVKGVADGDVLVASAITIQNTNTEIQVPWNGTVESLSGSSSAFQFVIGSKTIKGDAKTEFFGDGDKPDSFSTLKNGQRVEVKGLQRDGHLYAMRIHINGTDDGSKSPTQPSEQDSSASIEGPLNSISGSSPNLTLKVGTTTVTTSSSTEVQRRGDKQELSTLAKGMTVHVVGVRKSDGSIDARKVQIKDDETGGAFEIEGSLGGLKGTCPAVTFGVNGYDVVTGGATTFTGATCAELKSGNKVVVKGTRQANGSVLATNVTKK